MSALLPAERPHIDRPTAVKLLTQHGVGVSTSPALLGLRGYYKRTMGDPTANDRGIYDDAIVLVSPGRFLAFNGNTDPSKHQPGIATLALGTWSFKWGTHHPGTPGAYKCLVQAGPFTVERDGGVRETGEFYIHLHRGGLAGRSSLGCQTIPPSQWDEFVAATEQVMLAAGVTRIPYCLVEAP